MFRSETKMKLHESSGLTHLPQDDLPVNKLLVESTGRAMTREIKTVQVLRARDFCNYVCSDFAILNNRTTYSLEHPPGKKDEVNIWFQVIRLGLTQ